MIASLLILTPQCYSGFSESDWPMPYHDLEHTSYSTASSDLDIEEIILLKSYKTAGDILSPVAADVDGDDKAEILFSTKNREIYLLNHKLEVVWSKKLECSPTPAGVFDLEQDNKYEIIYGCSDGAVYVLNSSGNLIWRYQTEGEVVSTPTAGNLNYNRELEVVFTSKDKNLYILDYRGNKIRDYNLIDSVYAMPAIGDINADKKNEIILASTENKLSVYSSSGPETWIYDASGAIFGATIAKLDRTKYKRIVVGSGGGKLYSLYYTEYLTGTKIKCVEADCFPEPIKSSKLVPDWVFDNGGEEFHPPAAADLTGDGEPDYIAGTTGKNLYLINNNGSIIRKHSVNAKIVSTPAVADLDEDDFPEIVFGSADGVIQITNASGYKIWEFRGKNPVTQPPALADLDRDGKLEILVAAGDTLLVFGEEAVEEETTTTTTTSTTTTTKNPPTTTTTTTTTSTTTTTTTTTSTTTTISETKINELSLFGLPIYTILVVVIGLFFVLQVILLILVFTLPGIIQKRIDRLREEIMTYKSDLKSLEKKATTLEKAGETEKK